MEISKYRVQEFKDKQNIKVLLEKLGVPKELWDNDGHSFWEQNKEQLKYIFNICKQIYKKLAIQLHPREISDDDEPAKRLHSLWDAIEKRFDYKINRARLVPDFSNQNNQDGIDLSKYIECQCGCGKIFLPLRTGGRDKKYFSGQCRERYYTRQNTQRKRQERASISPEILICACGCGTKFTKRNYNQKYAFERCWRKIKSKEYYWKHLEKEKARARLKTLKKPKREFPTSLCKCGCNQLVINKGNKIYATNECRDKHRCKLKTQKAKERHENFKKILNGV